MSELDDLVSVAHEAARRAGDVLLRTFGNRAALDVRYKQGVDVVTQADLAAEDAIRSFFASETPHIRIVGEESGGTPDESGYTWVVDPLDGTMNYSHGYPFFSVSIGLVDARPGARKDDRPRAVAGCVHGPALRETFLATIERGTTLNGDPVRVSPVASLGESLLSTGFPYVYDYEGEFAHHLACFGAFVRASHGVRRDGSAALDMGYVAMGRYECYYEKGIKPWDVAAGLCLVEAAGGRATDYTGRYPDLDGGRFIVTNGAIHDAVLELIRRHFP